jgi:hypothetical protein
MSEIAEVIAALHCYARAIIGHDPTHNRPDRRFPPTRRGADEARGAVTNSLIVTLEWREALLPNH